MVIIEDPHARVQEKWIPTRNDLATSRKRMYMITEPLVELIRSDSPPDDIERIMMDIPKAERGKLAIRQAYALR